MPQTTLFEAAEDGHLGERSVHEAGHQHHRASHAHGLPQGSDRHEVRRGEATESHPVEQRHVSLGMDRRWGREESLVKLVARATEHLVIGAPRMVVAIDANNS